MKAVIQRVSKASVSIDDSVKSEIGKGLLILLGVGTDDTIDDQDYLIKKIVGMRIFNDENGVMNLSITDVDGDILVVSQFTLMANTKKGNRPSYINAARPEQAIPMYEGFVEALKQKLNKTIPTGTFGADMQVELINDGPVTILIDSKKRG